MRIISKILTTTMYLFYLVFNLALVIDCIRMIITTVYINDFGLFGVLGTVIGLTAIYSALMSVGNIIIFAAFSIPLKFLSREGE